MSKVMKIQRGGKTVLHSPTKHLCHVAAAAPAACAARWVCSVQCQCTVRSVQRQLYNTPRLVGFCRADSPRSGGNALASFTSQLSGLLGSRGAAATRLSASQAMPKGWAAFQCLLVLLGSQRALGRAVVNLHKPHVWAASLSPFSSQAVFSGL